jgi:hypothetical protein
MTSAGSVTPAADVGSVGRAVVVGRLSSLAVIGALRGATPAEPPDLGRVAAAAGLAFLVGALVAVGFEVAARRSDRPALRRGARIARVVMIIVAAVVAYLALMGLVTAKAQVRATAPAGTDVSRAGGRPPGPEGGGGYPAG